MNKFAMTLLVLHIFSVNAVADVFQIMSAAKEIRVVSATVTYNGQHVGYTNDQGIIIINNPVGQNTFTVSYMGKTTDVTLTISGNNGIQTITIP
jgi:hypothetical protein